MRRFSRSAVAVAAGAGALALTVAGLAPATAITGGTADGSGHPNVVMLLFYAKDAPGDPVAYRYRCSGSLVSAHVVLTAGHCTDGVVGKTLVFSQSEIALASPSLLPRAEGDTGVEGSAVGFVGTEVDGKDRSYSVGVSQNAPGFTLTYKDATHLDVGAVVLQSAGAATPVALAPTGAIDRIPQSSLNSTLFTEVGYGTEVRKPDSGPRKPTPESYPLIRRVATANGQKAGPRILYTNGNPNNAQAGKGDGGTCFGDSGGPVFLPNGTQVAVTSFGYTSNCRYVDAMQRVDIPEVHTWLASLESAS